METVGEQRDDRSLTVAAQKQARLSPTGAARKQAWLGNGWGR